MFASTYIYAGVRNAIMQHNYSLAFVAGLKRATDEGSLPEIAQYSPYYLPLNVFTASKGSNLYINCYYCSWCCAVWRP